MATDPPSSRSDEESAETPKPTADSPRALGAPRLTRASAAWVATGATLLLLILLIVFILQNSAKVEVHFRYVRHDPPRNGPVDRRRWWRCTGGHRRGRPGNPVAHERPPDQTNHLWLLTSERPDPAAIRAVDHPRAEARCHGGETPGRLVRGTADRSHD